jgi:hypothetical protein
VYKDDNRTLKELVLRILYKNIKEIVSSKVIIIKGWLLNANIIKIISINKE